MNLFTVLTKKFVKDGTSQFQNFHVNFHKFHALLSVKLSQARLCYHKFCATWVPKMFMGAHKTQGMAWVLTFLERYHKDGDEYLNHTA
jgi:hypothetical protein